MRTTFYEIKDRSGAIVALHKRVDRDDGSKEMAWLQPDGTSGLNGTPAAALPLYGAHRLAEWPDGAAVVLGEGEKVAEALWSIGVPAVATVCGAAVKPEASVLADLSGRPVICAPDNDTPGREHMTYNADTLADVAAVAWLEPDGRPDKWDLADAVAAGEDVRELLRAAVAWPLPVAYRTLADIDETPPAPLLLGMLERDGSTLLYAAPGTGKGLTGAWIVRELIEVGMRPAIFDAECRPKEWSRRVAGLGGDRSRVVYIEPVDAALVVTAIERLPASLDPVADRVRALADPEVRCIIDAEGLGSALWALLGHPDDADHWQLYAGRGLERQALVDELLVAIEEGRFHFAPGLAEQDAMTRALLGYRRQVREDGMIGSELVVALLLALIPPPPVIVPMVSFR